MGILLLIPHGLSVAASRVFENDALTLVSLRVQVENEMASLNAVQARWHFIHLHFAFLCTFFHLPNPCHYNWELQSQRDVPKS